MIRRYKDTDYDQLRGLYLHTEWYGGQFDASRDSQEKLAKISARDPEAILVYMKGSEVLGSISLIDDGRVAWLFRFVVKDNSTTVAVALYEKAVEVLRKRGHTQILVYCPIDNKVLQDRYEDLGMTLGSKFLSFWSEI
jgi:hypothetical protein